MRDSRGKKSWSGVRDINCTPSRDTFAHIHNIYPIHQTPLYSTWCESWSGVRDLKCPSNNIYPTLQTPLFPTWCGSWSGERDINCPGTLFTSARTAAHFHTARRQHGRLSHYSKNSKILPTYKYVLATSPSRLQRYLAPLPPLLPRPPAENVQTPSFQDASQRPPDHPASNKATPPGTQ